MKNKIASFVSIFGLLILAGASVSGQASSNWVRFETSARDLSISMPAGYLVHTEADTYVDRKTVYSFENGVNMVFSAADVKDAVGNLSRVKLEKERDPIEMNFRIGGFDGKYITYQKPNFQSTIYLAKKNTSYRIEISAASKDADEVIRVLRSIVVGGQRLATGDSQDAALTDVVSLKSLKTSPALAEIMDGKSEKHAGKVSFEPLAAFTGCSSILPGRPAIVLTSVHADMNRGFLDVRKGGEIRIRLDLLKNGFVGDIIVYSDVDVRVLRSFTDSAKKLKFVPASRDGAPVDSCHVVRFTFGVEVSTSIVRVS